MRRIRLVFDVFGVGCLAASVIALLGYYVVADLENQRRLLTVVFASLKFGFGALVVARLIDVARIALRDESGSPAARTTRDRRSARVEF
jgi:hypothetical protein